MPDQIIHEANGERAHAPNRLQAIEWEQRAARELAIKLHYAEITAGRTADIQWHQTTTDQRRVYFARALLALRLIDPVKLAVARADTVQRIFARLERHAVDRSQGFPIPTHSEFATELVTIATTTFIAALSGQKG